VQDVVEFGGSIVIDFMRGTETMTASVAAISIKDNANVARQRSSLELVQESALVNPVEKLQQPRWSKALIVEFSLPNHRAEIGPVHPGYWIDVERSSIASDSFENCTHFPVFF